MVPTTCRTIAVPTAEGVCPVHLHAPADATPRPGVLLLMDAPGIRPALHEIAARLAGEGYAVVMPDLFYRAGPYAPIDVAAVFSDPERRTAHRARFNATLTPAGVVADLRTIMTATDAWSEIAPGPYGAVGYCMGGRLALIAAGSFPDRIAAAASFHAGGLADDRPDSPQLLARQMRASVFVAGAVADANFPDDQKARLESALAEAGIEHRVETWPARHGWVPRDTPAHDPEQAERHWRVLVPLLGRALRV